MEKIREAEETIRVVGTMEIIKVAVAAKVEVEIIRVVEETIREEATTKAVGIKEAEEEIIRVGAEEIKEEAAAMKAVVEIIREVEEAKGVEVRAAAEDKVGVGAERNDKDSSQRGLFLFLRLSHFGLSNL